MKIYGYDGIPFEMDDRTFAVIATLNMTMKKLQRSAGKP